MTTEVTLARRIIFPCPTIRKGFYSLCLDWGDKEFRNPRLDTVYWNTTGQNPEIMALDRLFRDLGPDVTFKTIPHEMPVNGSKGGHYFPLDKTDLTFCEEYYRNL